MLSLTCRKPYKHAYWYPSDLAHCLATRLLSCHWYNKYTTGGMVNKPATAWLGTAVHSMFGTPMPQLFEIRVVETTKRIVARRDSPGRD